jgi:membrane protease YdiL (CAAX protease family)
VGAAIAIVFVVLQTVVLFTGVEFDVNAGEAQVDEQIAALAQDGYFLSLATFATTLVGCVIIAGVVKLKKGSRLREYLALRTVRLRTMLTWIGLTLCLIVLTDVLSTLVGRPIVPDVMLNFYETATPMWMLWVALIIGAPLFEETFFRGFLFKGLESSVVGLAGAVLVTAALWALIHVQYEAYEVSIIFLGGVLLGAARSRTGSLLVPLAMHAVVNLVATIEMAIVAAT